MTRLVFIFEVEVEGGVCAMSRTFSMRLTAVSSPWSKIRYTEAVPPTATSSVGAYSRRSGLWVASCRTRSNGDMHFFMFIYKEIAWFV